MESRDHRFDVDDRRAVDGLDRTNPQPVLGDLAHGDAMKAQWIWSVGRSRPKDISERATMVRARMDFWTVAPGPVEPTTYLINNRDSYPFRSTAFPEAFRR